MIIMKAHARGTLSLDVSGDTYQALAATARQQNIPIMTVVSTRLGLPPPPPTSMDHPPPGATPPAQHTGNDDDGWGAAFAAVAGRS
ncbi:MAG: hypothetical protein R3F53_05365 [Gammaproteobacteria bacterium]